MSRGRSQPRLTVKPRYSITNAASAAQSAWSAYGVVGFIGLAHYVMPQASGMPMSCTLTIGAEAASSGLLIAYAVLRSRKNPGSDRCVHYCS
jgi:hypothetical protein